MTNHLGQAIDNRRGRGVRVSAWLHADPAGARGAATTRKSLMKVLGLRDGHKTYPAQARMKGETLVVRCEAHYSPYENQSRGALRSYLERPPAGPDVLQEAPFEQFLDRWSIWVTPSEHDVSPWVAAHVMTQEMGRRYGISDEDVYAVMHVDPAEKTTGEDHDKERARGWHLHVVVPAVPGMELTRDVMKEISHKMLRELVLERAIDRALDPARTRPTESGWDLPATDAQLAVLRSRGKAGEGLNRGEASMGIEAAIGERSWYERGR